VLAAGASFTSSSWRSDRTLLSRAVLGHPGMSVLQARSVLVCSSSQSRPIPLRPVPMLVWPFPSLTLWELVAEGKSQRSAAPYCLPSQQPASTAPLPLQQQASVASTAPPLPLSLPLPLQLSTLVLAAPVREGTLQDGGGGGSARRVGRGWCSRRGQGSQLSQWTDRNRSAPSSAFQVARCQSWRLGPGQHMLTMLRQTKHGY
jgi:hypothetical protein